MERRLLIKQMFALVLVLFLVSCSAAATEVPPTPYPEGVNWETAVEILNSGDVEMVVQLHSLDVIFTMKDGSEIQTVEPTIDAIFAEIEKCGQPCSQIAVATE
jgi:hypothetical protein